MRREQGRSKRRIGDAAGDPLDGLVNLFDVGIVLAVAFLIAGLASTVNQQGKLEPRRAQGQEQQVPSPQSSEAATAKGRGTAVGTVYRLGDGRLVYTDGTEATSP